jgi:hypothetical protein
MYNPLLLVRCTALLPQFGQTRLWLTAGICIETPLLGGTALFLKAAFPCLSSPSMRHFLQLRYAGQQFILCLPEQDHLRAVKAALSSGSIATASCVQ